MELAVSSERREHTAQVSQNAFESPLFGRRLFVARDRVHHRWRTANKDLDFVLEASRREMLAKQLRGYIALLTSPALGSFIQYKEKINLFWVALLHLFQLLAQQNVLLGLVGENEEGLGLVICRLSLVLALMQCISNKPLLLSIA